MRLVSQEASANGKVEGAANSLLKNSPGDGTGPT